jgi:hypothetical protein
MIATNTQSNLVKNPLTSALNSKINPSPLSAPKMSNIGSSLSINPLGPPAPSQNQISQDTFNTQNREIGNYFNSPPSSGSVLSSNTSPGFFGALGNGFNTIKNIAGDVGNFAHNFAYGTTGGYNNNAGAPSTPASTGTVQGANNGTKSNGTTSLPNGGVTAGGGSYAGPASSNPNGIPAASTSTPAPVQNLGYGNSTPNAAVVGGGTQGAQNYTSAAQQNTANINNGTPAPNATPNVVYAGNNQFTYGAGGSPVQTQTDPSQTYGTGLNTQINYANGPGNSNVNTAVSGLQGQASNTPQSQAQGYLQGVAQNGTPAVNQANQALSSFTQGGGKLLNEIQSDPGLASAVSSGIAGNVAQQLGTTQGALATQAQNALTGQSNQIGAAENAGGLANTNQSNQITAGTSAGTTAQNQQSEQIGAAGTATGQAAPQGGVNYYSSPTNPNSVIGATGGTGNNITDALQRAGQYSATQSGANTYYTNDQQISGAQNQADSIGGLITNSGLNPLTLNLGNAGIQTLQNQMSNSDYATLQAGLSSIESTIKSITGQSVDLAQLASQNGQSLQTTISNQLALARKANAGNLTSNSGGSNSSSNSSPSNYGQSW